MDFLYSLYSNWYNLNRAIILFYFLSFILFYIFYSGSDDFGAENIVHEAMDQILDNGNFIPEDNLIPDELPSQELKVSTKTRLLQWGSIILIGVVKLGAIVYPFFYGPHYTSSYKRSK
jgi:hypothetical protein